jgi:deoxyribonuclease V
MLAQVRASSRHGTGGRLDCGVCAAVDVHYLSTGRARMAAAQAADAAFTHPPTERTAMVARVPAYRPGEFYEFYLREFPPLREVLAEVSGLSLLVVDGYADLEPGAWPGLGAHAHAEFYIR